MPLNCKSWKELKVRKRVTQYWTPEGAAGTADFLRIYKTMEKICFYSWKTTQVGTGKLQPTKFQAVYS